MHSSDPRRHIFHYGAWDAATSAFRFDQEAIENLRHRDVTWLSRCRDCFAKWQCAGGCQEHWFDPVSGEERPDTPDLKAWCRANRQVLRDQLWGSVGTKGDHVVLERSVATSNSWV